ncbi:DEAD/DEAH box helicase [Anaeromyxobacter oryzisoli]|uniref:DEAD/DEAH box helicase n=1 Tax=Anaeromyxobacter oryzisoli TaxID=2925408 RepID=UPI001F5777BC|nr:DEAD/DEAH box helicase [Anaeromyxobacter sp. SG63]
MLDGFHPLVRRWFEARFPAPTEPQALAWPAIAARRDVLVSAPTGSGKTLAAFLSAVDGLVRDGLEGRLRDETRVLYVSPLRALSNDIERNLRVPLDELRDLALADTSFGPCERGVLPRMRDPAETSLGRGGAFPRIRVAVRTGDTPASRRQALLRTPPHLLVTTPESLYLLLTTARGRAALASVETVIVDEIHALAGNKRGAHLALSLERLEAVARRRPQRIGLSATVHPVEEVARFLVGAARVGPRGTPRCTVVEVGRRRPLDLGVEVPRDELSAVASGALWAETYDRVAELVRAHRATLVFVNTRRLAERAAHALAERLGPDAVAAHHGSLSRERRLDAERRLKAGALRAVVATASLELGIDVGVIDLVVQLGSPGALAVGLQRAGRAGHVRGGTPKTRLFPTSRDELLECAALVRGLRRGSLEAVPDLRAPLDVLAQQVVAEASCGAIHEDRLFALVRRAWPYRDLARASFDAVLEMLAEGVAGRVGRATAHLHRDAVHGRVSGRRGARLAALTGAGTIPDAAQYAVVAEPEGITVGQLDEDFAVESLAGDVFLLGNSSWRIRRVEAGTVRVEDARGAPPTIPFWNGEAPGRSAALSAEVAALREELEPRLADPGGAAAWLAQASALPAAGAVQAVAYLAASRAVLGALPTDRTLVAERFFDEAGGMQLVIHAPLGARVNRALGLALRKRFCRRFDFELQAAATDEGVLLSLGPQHAFPLESIFALLSPGSIDEVLAQAALQAPMFPVRWRWAATRALAIPRLFKGRRTPPAIARMRSDDLLAAVFPAQVACQDNAPGGPIEIPAHPLVTEALRDCLEEAMDAPALRALVARMRAGELRLLSVDTAAPSPLAHEILGARPWAYLDDAPLEERRARAVTLRRALPESEAAGAGALDPAAMAAVEEQLAPDVRDAEELHDLLLDVGVLPEAEARRWSALLAALREAGRAARMLAPGAPPAWMAAERAGLAAALAPALRGHGTAAPALDPPLRPLPSERVPTDPDDAVLAVVRGWAPRLGPVTADGLAARLGLAADRVALALVRLEADGRVLRGTFLAGTPATRDAPHWCERTVLARIHRLTLDRLRREIEPVTAADLLRFLLRWQHLAPGTRLHGERGLAEVIGQLQGFHAAAGAWERELLAARVEGYAPELLDRLCLGGEVAFGRLAAAAAPAPPGAPDAAGAPAHRAQPTRAFPLTLALREDLGWLLEAAGGPPPRPGLEARGLAAALASRGASFATDLAAALGRPRDALAPLLLELVASGAATCDAFAGLRALWDRRRSRVARSGSGGGRWSLLRPISPPPDGAPGEAGGEDPPEPLLERLAQQYLRRYGVVFRDLLAREDAPPWRALVRVYRTLEARGAIRGGRFVSGFTGEQFALPEAVDALRAVRRAPRAGDERVTVSAVDPLNLVGILTPGPRVSAASGRRVEYVAGVPSAAPAGATRGEPRAADAR